MDHTLGYITLNGLLSLNTEEVQAHLNSVQWPNTNDLVSFNAFYSETQAIFLITIFIDAILEQPTLAQDNESQNHILALRRILHDEHQTRLIFLGNNHGPFQQ